MFPKWLWPAFALPGVVWLILLFLVRLDDHDPVKTAGPQTIEQNPQGPVQPRQPGAGSLTVSKNLQLVAKSHHLELQVNASPQAGKKAMNERNDDLAHDTDATGRHLEKPGFLRRTEFMGGTGDSRGNEAALWPASSPMRC